MIFFNCKSKAHIEFSVLQALGKTLKALFDPMAHDKDQLMAQVGDTLLKNGVVRKIDENHVISCTNIEVDSRELLDKVKNELDQKKAEKQRKAEERKKKKKHNQTLFIKWLFL